MSDKRKPIENVFINSDDTVVINHEGERVGVWCSSPDDLVDDKEYILKSIAYKQREDILNPIRHVMRIAKFYPVLGRSMLEGAIYDSLRIADNAGGK